MNSDFFSDFRDLLSEVWQHYPILLIVVGGGFVIFILVVIDTHRHRKTLKGRHKKRLH